MHMYMCIYVYHNREYILSITVNSVDGRDLNNSELHK